MHPDTHHRVALSRVFNIGPILSRALLAHFGSAAAVFQAKPKALRAVPGIGNQIIGELQLPKPQYEAEQIIRFAERQGIQIIHFQDENYPTRLREQTGAPPLLYYKGTAELDHRRTIAVIGTRKPSARGIRQTEHLLATLQPYQPLVISGLAYGIDICAHRESLKQGLPTLGVLGSGLQKIYPHAHRATAQEMLAAGGILTTYPHWIGPERDHFPARNRIVAMLADIVIVVESAMRGGSIITAQMAKTMQKPLAAFPARYDDKNSAGSNDLIKNAGAHLIESGDDIGQLMGWHISALHNKQGSLFQCLDEQEQAIVAQLSQQTSTAVDELGRSLSWPATQLAGKLLEMEIKGLIKVLPGHRYRLCS